MDKKLPDLLAKDQPNRKRPRPVQQEREAQALAAKRAENLRNNLLRRKEQARSKQDSPD
jgi:hypothetical protein